MENEHDDVPKKFVECLEDTLREIVRLYDNPKKMIYGKERITMLHLPTWV